MKHHPSITGIHKSRSIYSILLVGFIFTLHLALPYYVNSSLLGQFTSESNIGFLYISGSIVTILALLFIEKILDRFGSYRTTIALILIQIILFFGLTTANSLSVISICFVMGTAVIAILGMNLDIFLESYSNAKNTGGVRGLFLTINNTAWVLAPLIVGLLIVDSQYRIIYGASLGTLFILLYLVKKNLSTFKDPNYGHFSLKQTLIYIFRKKDYSKLFAINVILNVFYSWMVIYSPVYLHERIGFGWDQISIILTIMLLPFVIFQLPAGRLADQGWGEKKLMTIGFIIMGLSTISLAFLTIKSVFAWALLLFIGRIGAAIAEAMIEIYFFKKVKPEDSDVLGMFRITRPISGIIAPAISAVGLLYTTDANLFIILGIIVFWAIRYTLTLTDTESDMMPAKS